MIGLRKLSCILCLGLSVSALIWSLHWFKGKVGRVYEVLRVSGPRCKICPSRSSDCYKSLDTLSSEVILCVHPEQLCHKRRGLWSTRHHHYCHCHQSSYTYDIISPQPLTRGRSSRRYSLHKHFKPQLLTFPRQLLDKMVGRKRSRAPKVESVSRHTRDAVRCLWLFRATK